MILRLTALGTILTAALFMFSGAHAQSGLSITDYGRHGVAPHSLMTFTIVAQNAGAADATGVTVITRLPSTVHWTIAYNSFGNCALRIGPTGQTLVCTGVTIAKRVGGQNGIDRIDLNATSAGCGASYPDIVWMMTANGTRYPFAGLITVC